MFFPGNIKNTMNVFHCFLSILYISNNNPNLIIGCPGLGTGVGLLTPKEAVDQMELAIEHYNILNSDTYKKLIKYSDQNNLILHKMACVQPDNYANKEIPY